MCAAVLHELKAPVGPPGVFGVVGQIAVQAATLLGAGRVAGAARHRETPERLRDATVVLEGHYRQALKDAAGDGHDVVIDPLHRKIAPVP